MIAINIPGHSELHLNYRVSDYNGTLACDGILFPEIVPLLQALSDKLEIHVITADTFGLAGKNLSGLPVTLAILSKENQQAQGKLDYVEQLGLTSAVCLGNGRNDELMLREAALGVCLLQAEGTNVRTLLSADVVCQSAADALNLLLKPKRLVATLRK